MSVRVGELRPTSNWCLFCLNEGMAAVLAIHKNGGESVQHERPLTQLNRVLNPWSPGRILSLTIQEADQQAVGNLSCTVQGWENGSRDLPGKSFFVWFVGVGVFDRNELQFKDQGSVGWYHQTRSLLPVG